MSRSEIKRTLVSPQQSLVALPESHMHRRLLVRKGFERRVEDMLRYEHSGFGFFKGAMRVSH